MRRDGFVVGPVLIGERMTHRILTTGNLVIALVLASHGCLPQAERRESARRDFTATRDTRRVDPSNVGKLSYHLPLSLAAGCLPGRIYL